MKTMEEVGIVEVYSRVSSDNDQVRMEYEAIEDAKSNLAVKEYDEEGQPLSYYPWSTQICLGAPQLDRSEEILEFVIKDRPVKMSCQVDLIVFEDEASRDKFERCEYFIMNDDFVMGGAPTIEMNKNKLNIKQN